jgi:hypothetical protein
MTKRLLSPAVLRVTALAGALLALALPVSVASAAEHVHGIIVLDNQSQTVALFRSGECHLSNQGFFADAENRGYHLTARVLAPEYKGFHRYTLKRGHTAQVFVQVTSPSHVVYASDFVPPYPVAVGGGIDLRKASTEVGVAFGPMFSADGTDVIDVTGVMKCKYPKKKH